MQFINDSFFFSCPMLIVFYPFVLLLQDRTRYLPPVMKAFQKLPSERVEEIKSTANAVETTAPFPHCYAGKPGGHSSGK